MRVAHVITRLILGGAQENTLLTVEDLVRDHGDDVLLITGPAEGHEGDLFERVARNRVRLQLVPELRRAIRPWSDANAYRRLKRIFRTFAPEVVHTHSSKAGILGRAAAHDHGVPAIVHTIHGLPFHPYQSRWKNALYKAAERWGARHCHRIISVADAMTRQALAAGVGRPEQFVTIPSGLEVESFLYALQPRTDVRRELGYGPDDIVVVKVARLFELKGHDDVVEAAAKAVAIEPRLRFLFVGGGRWESRILEHIRQRNLLSYFQLTGLVPPERIPELLAAGDIVVHASYREGLARVLPEALLTQRPVISYDVDGAAEVVRPGQTGILVPPKDVAGLTRAILELAADPERRSRFGRTGRELFADGFRHQTTTQQIRAVYEAVLAKRRSLGSEWEGVRGREGDGGK